MFCPGKVAEHSRGTKGGDLHMPTGKQAAKDAGKVLADPKATPAEKKAAASDLAQTPSKGKK